MCKGDPAAGDPPPAGAGRDALFSHRHEKSPGTLAPIGAITGDFLAGSAQNGVGGIGFMTIAYFSQLKIPALFATGLAACLLGFIFVGGVNLLHWYLLHQWHDSLVKKE